MNLLLVLFYITQVALADVSILFSSVSFHKTDFKKLCVVTLENIYGRDDKINNKTVYSICSNPDNYRHDVVVLNYNSYYRFVISLSFGQTPMHITSDSKNALVLTDKLLREKVFETRTEFDIKLIHIEYDNIIFLWFLGMIAVIMAIVFCKSLMLIWKEKQEQKQKSNNSLYIKTVPFTEENLMGDTVASENEQFCSICMVNKARVVMVPCGHVCICVRCAEMDGSGRCVICRKQVEATLIVYL